MIQTTNNNYRCTDREDEAKQTLTCSFQNTSHQCTKQNGTTQDIYKYFRLKTVLNRCLCQTQYRNKLYKSGKCDYARS